MPDIKQRAAASRFLMQASLGADRALIDQVAKQGVEPWLKKQLAANPQQSFETQTRQIWQYFRAKFKKRYGQNAINGEGNNPALPYKWYFHMAWWHLNLTRNETDVLRQRVAQALSELLVISDKSALELDSVGFASYYDLLYRHAFGRYADLLTEVSMHPCMGVYLSHMNNQKAVPAEHIHPDENYAREIMQLFSIGLFELNQDGSRKKDSLGRDIPSYDNSDIKTLARVFTGLTASNYRYEWQTKFWRSSYNGYPVGFNDGIDKTYKTVPFVDMTKPMVVHKSHHDTGSKTLLNGRVKVAANMKGEAEIRSVVRQLVAHPNTAPFVARFMINRLVTSNPSGAYIKAVAAAFGEAGDLKALVQEILLYPRKHPKSYSLAAAEGQKLKAPLLRATQVLKAFNADNKSAKRWLTGEMIDYQLQQHPMSSPTVFNFYKPDYAPHGPIQLLKQVAPEFELHNSATSIAYVNLMYYWIFGGFYPGVATVVSSEPGVKNAPELNPEKLNQNSEDKLRLDFGYYEALAAKPENQETLIRELAILLTGKAEFPLQNKLLDAVRWYREKPKWVVQTFVFLILVSAEFTVLEGATHEA